MGNALWERRAGQVDGALQFDGVSTYVSTPFILNPIEVPFSVFAWIKGGEPGQSIISQNDGADWLAADTSEGQLSTRLSPPSAGRFPVPTPPLISDIVITDGNWHRVGLVWDELDRILYVDDVEVAREVVGYPESSDGDLYLGTGSNGETGTFWSD